MDSYIVYGSDRWGGTHPCYVKANSSSEALRIAKEKYDYDGRYAIQGSVGDEFWR